MPYLVSATGQIIRGVAAAAADCAAAAAAFAAHLADGSTWRAVRGATTATPSPPPPPFHRHSVGVSVSR